MRLIDPHIHVDTRPWEELEEMAVAGIRVLISPTYYPHLFVKVTPETIFDYFERILKFEKWRAEQCFGLKLFVAVGLNPVIIPADYRVVLRKLPEYLSDNTVVAIGEIGLEPGSKLCPDMEKQREVVLEQLKTARQYRKPVIFHTPHQDKIGYVKQDFELVEEAGLAPDMVVVDHSDRSVAREVLGRGAYLGITVQPWRNLSAADAASIIKDFGTEHVLVDSDCSVLRSDHLSVPKTALELRRAGFSELDVEKVLYDNPRMLYRLEI